MWFDASAALKQLGEGGGDDAPPPATLATPATPRARVAIVAKVAPPEAQNQDDEHSRHGLSVAGHPITWTGRVVSLSNWRKLGAWDRHGPDGRHWCGIAQDWK